MVESCPLCHAGGRSTIFAEFDVEIFRCRDCGHVYSAWQSSQDYDGYFGGEDLGAGDPEWWYEAHRAMYDDFCARFLSGAPGRLLDFGCGLGYFVKHVTDKTSWDVRGLEISPVAVDFARTRLGLEEVRLMGGGGPPPPEQDVYDLVTMWDVLEHVPDPHAFLDVVAPRLEEGGRLFIHTPNAAFQLLKARLKRMVLGMKRGTHYLEARDHLNLYTMDTLRRLLNMHGFGEVEFVHLSPIGGVARKTAGFWRAVKTLWYRSSVVLFHLTGGRVNMDNLFAVARRSGG